MRLRLENISLRDSRRILARSALSTALIPCVWGVLIVTMGVTPVSIALALIAAGLVRTFV